MRFRLPASLHNWISLAGIIIASVTFLADVTMLAATFVVPVSDFYLGLFTYIIMPAIVVAGLILIPLGMYLKRRRDKREGIHVDKGWPCVDLNNPAHRKGMIYFLVATAIYLLVTGVGSYEAFHVTESVEFCGLLCHKVMKPQYVLYESSSHAKVPCASCHVGPGASWFVKSKLSGAQQIVNTIQGDYPRPLTTPIKNLRPARAICEQCHWPQKFYAYKLRYEPKFLSDEQNTSWYLRMVMKIGSEHPTAGLKEGIHWHINPNVKVEYIALDKRRQEIPWVRLTNLRTGDVTIYQDRNRPIDPSERDGYQVREMDCMDCHNEPSHEFLSPAEFITHAMVAGDIPLDLPNVKAVSMEACAQEYATEKEGLKGIGEYIHRYYEQKYPQVYRDKERQIDQAVSAVQAVFRKNIFPEMKSRWSVYPNNIGHREFKGCFRCHTDQHVSEKGFIIRKNCSICHLINAQGKPGEIELAGTISEGLEFRHPVDIGVAWKDGLCTQCHTGLNP